jgi:predicted dehydrogenase
MEHRVGIIGAGDVVRRSYLPVLSRRADCRIEAICSAGGDSARALASAFGIPRICRDYREVLQQPEVETVFIVTPPHVHREIAEEALRRGKQVLVEKPLCPNYEDCYQLLARASRYTKTFYVAFNNQFREENQWLRSKVVDGQIGNPEVVDFEWFRTKRYEDKLWLYDAQLAGGGVLMDLGVHLIHLALSMFPQRKRFQAVCSQPRRRMGSGVEDTAISMVTVNRKSVVLIKTGWDMPLPVASKVTLNVYGDRGFLSNLDFNGNKSDGFSHMIDDFFHHIEAGTKPDLKLVGDTAASVDALYESSVNGSVIERDF